MIFQGKPFRTTDAVPARLLSEMFMGAAFLAHILTTGRTSRIYKDLIQDKQLAVSVYAGQGPGTRFPNLFTFNAVPRFPHTVEEVEKGILEHVERVKVEPVTERELQKVKNNLDASYIRSMSSNFGIAAQIVRYQLLFGDWKLFKKYRELIAAVTPADIMDFAKTYLTPENGIRVAYLQDTELPLVWVLGYFKGGGLYEPAGKTGLAQLTATVMRTGGTKTRNGDQINEELEYIAATIEAGGGSEFMQVTGSALKKDFGKLMEVYADLAMNQSLEGIRRRWDQPMQVSNIRKVTKQDILEAAKKYMDPDKVIVVVVGDEKKFDKPLSTMGKVKEIDLKALAEV